MIQRTKAMVLGLLVLLTGGHAAAQRVGEWTGYISYNRINHLAEASSRIYGASPMGLAFYDTDDMTINSMSKGTGLSDVGICALAYDPATKYLVVAYNNSNIDLIKGDDTHNISAIKQSGIIGNKSINNIRFSSGKAYLACGFGIVVLNLKRHEVEDTYYIGADGGYVSVYDIAFTDTAIIAATSEGLKWANRNTQYLNITDNWHADNSTSPAAQNPVMLETSNGHLLVGAYTIDPLDITLYRQTDTGYVAWCEGSIETLRNCYNNLVVTMSDSVCIYDTSFQKVQVIKDYTDGDMLPHDALLAKDGRLWIGHDWAGMVVVDKNGSMFNTCPSSPGSDNAYRIRSLTNGIAVCPGGKSSTSANQYIDGNLYVYKKRYWELIDKGGKYCYDILDMAVDPRDSSHWMAASWGCGLVEIRNGKIETIYNETNTNRQLMPYVNGEFRSLRTGSVAYDFDGNLWATNSLQPNGLVVRHSDGSWKSFNTNSLVNSDEISQILWDSVTGYKWFLGNANKIYVHDGESRMAWVDPNNGSKMETSGINCMTQDQNGNIWLGTNKGIKVIYDGYKAFNNGGSGEKAPVNCSNILFSEGDIVEYLLAYENITCITVDGANRKWVGTAAGGLYLLSETGMEQLENFTFANSPIYSNKIVTVGIHPRTGEVFIGTDKGIQSYRGTATYAEKEPQKKIHVFPNPVRPDYDGPVAFRGFTRNGVVHITDEAGHVVYSTRAEGGQAIWYIRNHDGVRASGGVYFIFASDEDGSMKSVGKVLVIK